jgi:hypothetical protein
LDVSTVQKNEVKGVVNVVNLGFSLGYQFIFWERLSLDFMVFGPSLRLTRSKGEFIGDLDPEEIEDIDKEI